MPKKGHTQRGTKNDNLIRKVRKTTMQGDNKGHGNFQLLRQITGSMGTQSVLKNHILCKDSEKEMMSCCFPQSKSRGHAELLLGVRAYKTRNRRTFANSTQLNHGPC